MGLKLRFWPAGSGVLECGHKGCGWAPGRPEDLGVGCGKLRRGGPNGHRNSGLLGPAKVGGPRGLVV